MLDLNLDVRLAVCPIVRDPDGLAMSSRNAYLSAGDRQAALALSRSLQHAREVVESGETNACAIIEAMRAVFAAEPGAKLEYAAIVEALTLRPVTRAEPGSVALVAARVGGTRLIDNTILAPCGTSEEERLEMALRGSPIAEAHSVL